MACPVCFSAVEPSIRESMNMGILVLLGVTAAVLTCFARFFLLLARRSREANTDDVAAGVSRSAVRLKADATS
jgi:hypothetical protein